jgi:peroxiredoxin/predicted 2-oxoglutarate/Fe(II)-dependent dioxygenase YbiX
MAGNSRLEVGDFLPDFQLTNQHGTSSALISCALGKSIVILFFADDRSPATELLLSGFVEQQVRLGPYILLVAINGATAEANAECALYAKLPFPVLADPDGAAARAYGIEDDLRGGQKDPAPYSVVIADANRRIVRRDRGTSGAALADGLAAYFENQPRPKPREIVPAAPILYVPGVFDRDFCRRMIELYETGGNAPSGVFQSDYREAGGLLNADTKDRRDHIVVDPAVNNEVGGLIGKRVVPEILKAFSFQVKYVKEFKIGCYEAASGGFFRPHRDNLKPIGTGRRFAMTLNLNTGEYEGGFLRFPEYGPHLYRPAAGDAVVFACNLLHEATPVTAGRRFVLLTFFYGPDGEGDVRG